MIKAFLWICLAGGDQCFGIASDNAWKATEIAACQDAMDEKRSALFELFKTKGLNVTIEGFCSTFDKDGQPTKGDPA